MFIGVIVSLITILVINKFTIVDNCLDNGGSFSYETGQCLLANNEIHTASFTPYLVGIYFILGIIIAFTVFRIIKKLFKLNTE